MSKVERLEAALRTERDTLRKEGNLTCANVINTYIQNADTTSKERLFDLLTKSDTDTVSDEIVIRTNFEMQVKWDQVANAWVGAIEGSYSPWLVGVAPGGDRNSGMLRDASKGRDTVWYADEQYWKNGGHLIADHDDPETDDDGDGSKQTLVTKESIIAGLQKMAEKSPSHFGDMISENDDAITHDVFAQYVLLGEIVYG